MTTLKKIGQSYCLYWLESGGRRFGSVTRVGNSLLFEDGDVQLLVDGVPEDWNGGEINVAVRMTAGVDG